MSDAELMAQHVMHARAALEQGALMRDALERLWQEAYATGVTRGKQEEPESAAARLARGGQVWPAAMGGWRWGPAELHGLERPGQRLRYGGPSASGPTCDRLAQLVRAASGRLLMRLLDTGEQVAVPACLWAQPEPREGGEDA